MKISWSGVSGLILNFAQARPTAVSSVNIKIPGMFLWVLVGFWYPIAATLMKGECYLGMARASLMIDARTDSMSAVVVSANSECPSTRPLSSITQCDKLGSTSFNCSMAPLHPGLMSLCLCLTTPCDASHQFDSKADISFLVRPHYRPSDVVSNSNSTPTAISVAGSTILTGHLDGSIQLKSASNSSILWTGSHKVTSDPVMVTIVKFSPSAEYCVSAGTDLRLVLWKLSNGSATHLGELRQLYEITAIAWSGDRFLVGTSGGLLELYDVNQSKPVSQLLVGCGITFISWDNEDFLVGCSNGKVSRWSGNRMQTWQARSSIVTAAILNNSLLTVDITGETCLADACWKELPVLSVAVSPDQRLMAFRTLHQVIVYDSSIELKGRWTSVDVSAATLNWSLLSGDALVRFVDDVLTLTPRGIFSLVDIRLNLPFKFSRVEGWFSSSLNCEKSEPVLSEWSDGSRLRWVLLAKDRYPSSGCISLDVGVVEDESVCRSTCVAYSGDTISISFSADGSFYSCEVFKCDSPELSPVAKSSRRFEVWRVFSGDRFYVAFGTEREIVYSGCASNASFSGEVTKSNSLRFQLSSIDIISLVDLNIRIYVPEPAPVLVLNSSLISPGDVAAPTFDVSFGDGFIAGASSTDVVLWDIKSLQISVSPSLARAGSSDFIYVSGASEDSVWLTTDASCTGLIINGVFVSDVWRFSVPADPGKVFVCWCSSTCCPTGAAVVGDVLITGLVSKNVQWFCGLEEPCYIIDVKGVGLTVEDKLMLSLDGSCGSLDLVFPGFSGGSRFFITGGFAAGANFTLCWCSGYSNCDDQANFTLGIGSLLFTSYQLVSGDVCYLGIRCVIIFSATSGPIVRGDKLSLKRGACSATSVVVGPVTCKDDACSQFDLGVLDQTLSGEVYNVCLLQSSSLPDFLIDTRLKLSLSNFPSNCSTEFTGWRMPWLTMVDCCCNFKEAGANPGCEDPQSSAWATCNNQNNPS